MAQAYDFALDKIGMEIMSYQVRVFSAKHYDLMVQIVQESV